ncbi:MAG: hypothetical protein B7Y86_09775 [Brevundimonas subvibrioides]|jgi:hypothetical protein|uniref:Secreted protein n=1 Tax=Brevundimonas subvibrioides TaxID=74313 RepID=A0A258HJ21_9CAUL|nr:hypothetical protein [Brevundimonas subvibrioides]OYX57015.1 MAG: hypothetical protein B7Y86_09775 [Brevundimonas subvibrioides]
MRAVLPLLALCVAFAAAPAVAQAPSSAATRVVLADASRVPTRSTVIDGANWRCQGQTCTASGGADQPAPRACRRVAARLGPVTEFSWKGTTLSAEQLAVCNA